MPGPWYYCGCTGLLSYRSYWKEVILSHIAECKDDAEISVRNMSQTTGIMPYDVIR